MIPLLQGATLNTLAVTGSESSCGRRFRRAGTTGRHGGKQTLAWAVSAAAVLGTLAPGRTDPAEPGLKLPPPPHWQQIARRSPGLVSPSFNIAGKTQRIPDDLVVILDHYQRRAPYAYGAQWMKKNLYLDRYVDAGKRLLEKGEFQYGKYAPATLSLSSLTWNESPFSNLNWPWYHHQLISVHYLLAVAQKENSARAVDAAKQIVRSWAAANYTTPLPSPQSWNDHSTAYRLRTLMCLFEHLRAQTPRDVDFLDLLLRMIDTHCGVLADESFYARHTNHGLDQATILLWAASAFPELAEADPWLRLSQDRLRDEVSFMFSPEGIHVENSPNYHVWMLGAVEELLLMSEDLKRADFDWIINGGWEYAAHALQPNGRFPLVGDTESLDFSRVRGSRAFPGCRHYLYSATGGKAGTKPELADAIFPVTGYAILRDRWPDAANFRNTVYLFFKCSFLANYHRHDDDLSVVLSAFGEEWLIDSGLYGYEEEDPLRRYMLSPDAHNTVVVPGTRVIRDVSKLPAPGSRIVEYGVEAARTFVTGSSRMYDGWVVTRRLEYLKPDRIVIRDSVSSAAETVRAPTPFHVLFHVPSDKRISIRQDNQVVVSSPNGPRLLLAVTPTPSRVRLVSGKGDGKDGFASWVSEGITQLAPSQCLRVDFQGTQSSTCTLTLESRHGETETNHQP